MQESNGRLFSLWEIMKVFRAASLALGIQELEKHIQECAEGKKKAVSAGNLFIASAPPKTAPDASELNGVKVCLEDLQMLCKEIKLSAAGEQIAMMLVHFKHHSDEVDYSSLGADLRNAFNALMNDLWTRIFVQIPEDHDHFVDNDLLFGKDVKEKFNGAVPDIMEAGNCLAVGSSTAAVFHLMRIAECGLRALAHDRRVKLDKNKPIDLGTWEDLLVKLEAAEQAIQGFKKTHAREAQFDFYHGAMMEVRGFKNKFRNRVMHSRESYDQHEAMSAFTHVKGFMQILATRISEGKRTPIVWKSSRWLKDTR